MDVWRSICESDVDEADLPYLRMAVARPAKLYRSLVDLRFKAFPYMRTNAHWRVFIYLVDNHSTRSMKDIALKIDIDPKTAKRILRDLDIEGVVKCESDAGDRRVKHYAITARGIRLFLEYFSHNAQEFQAYSRNGTPSALVDGVSKPQLG